MNLTAIDAIAHAVLYEGYMLYPYRPSSVKNQQRWNFGVLCPRSYSEAQNGSEAWTMQTECVLLGQRSAVLDIRIRFLQLVQRTIGELLQPTQELPVDGVIPGFRPVPSLTVAGKTFRPWQEAVEREIQVPAVSIENLALTPLTHPFVLPAGRQVEPVREADGGVVAVICRDQEALRGDITIMLDPVAYDVFRLRTTISNLTAFEVTSESNRDDALLKSFASTHTVLGIEGGAFSSMTAPDAGQIAAVAECKNIGTWPVLVGEEGSHDTMLSSPIILYDYPQIAPESAGDLFDGTEIDEILSLRIMTLTDEEKSEMRQSDDRARMMLERTETMPMEQLMKLHGVLRNVRPCLEEEAVAQKDSE